MLVLLSIQGSWFASTTRVNEKYKVLCKFLWNTIENCIARETVWTTYTFHISRWNVKCGDCTTLWLRSILSLLYWPPAHNNIISKHIKLHRILSNLFDLISIISNHGQLDWGQLQSNKENKVAWIHERYESFIPSLFL